MDQTEGFATEQSSSDDISLGKVTVSGVSGTGLDAGNVRVVNIPDTPGAGTDAVNKNYVDAVAQGLAVKLPVKAVAVSNVASLSGPQSVDSVSLVANDRVLLTAQSDVKFSGTGDSIDVLVGGTGDSLTFATGTVTLVDSAGAFTANDVGKRLTIAGASNSGNNGTFVIASYVDATSVTFANASGVTETSSFTYSSTDVRLIDAGGTFPSNAAGMKITVAGASNSGNNGTFTIYSRISGTAVIFANAAAVAETSSFTYTGETGVDNGIWVVQTGAWTRPVDFATGTHSGHAFVFVEDGSVYADTGWVCTSNAPADVIGTNQLTWVQFSAAGVILAGNGLTKVGNTISVKKGDGIEVTSNSNSTNIDLATNPGLALSGTSPNKKLTALVDAAGGVQINGSSGLALYLNGTTLQTSGSGVSVKGVPNLFEIGGTPTSQTAGVGVVTAANLNTLTAGSASNADALHVHTISASPKAERVEKDYAVGESIAAADPVYWTSTNDRIGKGAANNSTKSRIVGIARTAQSTPGNTAPIVTAGPCAGILSSATAGTPYYLGATGGITSTIPTTGNRIIEMGFAMNETDLFVRVVDYGKKV